MTEKVPAGAVLYVKDLSRMTAFYKHVLGVPVHADAADHVILHCGGLQLVLHAIPAAIAETITILQPPARREDTALKLSLPVHSLEIARLRALESGGVLDAEAFEWTVAGRRYCNAQDPEGNVFQLHDKAKA